MLFNNFPTADSRAIGEKVEDFVRNVVIPYEKDLRNTAEGPTEELVRELRDKANKAGIMTPHIRANGEHLTQLETAAVLKCSGLSPLGPVALNTMAPDEGNMYLLGKVASAEQKERFLKKLVSGAARSAFFMTEPANDGGAGSDPSMLQTTAVQDGDNWVINGKKIFITGATGAEVGIIMARTSESDGRIHATMFLVDLPNPAVRIIREIDNLVSYMTGGHCIVIMLLLVFCS